MNVFEKVFFGHSSPEEGVEALGGLLEILNHFGMSTENPETSIRQNIAKELLTLCNRWGGNDSQKYIESLPRKEEDART